MPQVCSQLQLSSSVTSVQIPVCYSDERRHYRLDRVCSSCTPAGAQTVLHTVSPAWLQRLLMSTASRTVDQA